MKDKDLDGEAAKQGFGTKLWGWMGAIGAILATLVGLGTNAGKIVTGLNRALSVADKLLFNGRIAALFLNRPVWLLGKLGYLFLVESAVMAGMILLWGPYFKNGVSEGRKRRVALISAKLAGSIGLSLLLSILAFGLASDGSYWHGDAHPLEDVAVLCPQCMQLGACAVRTYANNGSVHYSIDTKGEPGGPRGHAKITLQANLPDDEHGAGWVIFLPRGSDLNSFKQLRFWVRGEKGGEQIGVKIKDAQGVEVPVLVNNGYILGGQGITAEWKEVSLPLENFPQVNFSLIDNFSIFINGKIAGTRPQTIFVGGFEWR